MYVLIFSPKMIGIRRNGILQMKILSSLFQDLIKHFTDNEENKYIEQTLMSMFMDDGR